MASGKALYAHIATLLVRLEASAGDGSLSRADRASLRIQIAEIADLLSPRNDSTALALVLAFRQLAARLDAQVASPVDEAPSVAEPLVSTPGPVSRRARKADKVRTAEGRRLTRDLRRVAAMVAAAATLSTAVMSPGPVRAAIPTYSVGGSITNPQTGATETVEAIVNGGVVRTKEGHLIVIATTVGDTFQAGDFGVTETVKADPSDPDPAPAANKTYKVSAVIPSSGPITSVKVKDTATNVEYTLNLVTSASDKAADSSGGLVAGGGLSYTPAVDDVRTLSYVKVGDSGKGGSAGGGVRICFGFLGCLTVGKNAGSGGNGQNGPDINETIDASKGPITSVSDGLPGIVASSYGGNGGKGGDGWGVNVPGASGGMAGKGGTVILHTDVEISTSGKEAQGIFAQSRAGTGGAGGKGYIASGGGAGGAAAQAGAVYVYNSGDIYTKGEKSAGIQAQSLGGGAGGGGSSYGIVADPGAGSVGGDGGLVWVENSGSIGTEGVDAYGIFAQSVGGSGGASGSTGSLVSLGTANGGSGGNGGAVTVKAKQGSRIVTLGKGASGILAQSIGGGGGVGGSAAGLVALGSGGGSGGDGGVVWVENAGSIETGADLARGIFAQSVGGGGGTGGDAGALAAIGGKGGAASDGKAVTVINTGDITTHGAKASGIQAQSVGGGGGDGGSSGGVFLTIGGDGKTGGDSGLVTVTHGGRIETTGNDSHGIFAQSVGGGGGSGGSATSVSLFAGVAIGGQGDSGGTGGDVTVNLTPTTVVQNGQTVTVNPLIKTGGDRARGIFAQSVGGGGGAGGFAAQTSVGYGVGASIALGGDGAAGGASGLVTIDGDVDIITSGESAEGIFAQSVGGGGGAGGFAMSFSFAAGETAAAAFAIGIGGTGGAGGDGGVVDIDSGGSIQTDGRFSTGLVAQSVGGGGGTGGFALTFAGAAAGAASASASVGIGGSGGKGGDGLLVDTSFDGSILTKQDDSGGALIQSVGGGGGGGGFAIAGALAASAGVGGALSAGVGGNGGDGGDGGQVTGYVGGPVTTYGDRSTAVTIQSLGGGGGSGGFSVAGSLAMGTGALAVGVGVGGSGGGGGDANTVKGTADGAILTDGVQSGGLLVQSVGGGGGSGGFTIAGGIGAGSTGAGAISVGVGGSGGGGGDAGNVTGKAGSSVVTLQDQSNGVTVQSIGGGGGSGGFSVSGAIGLGGTGSGAIAVGVGGSGGGGGHAKGVTAEAQSILTVGDQSTGFLAQSVGGGGGSGGFNISGALSAAGTGSGAIAVGVGGAGGLGGNAGDPLLGETVDATVNGSVDTWGDGSAGVVAQSIGGGGGSGGFNVSGAVALANTGAGAISVGVGGSGGGGGNASEVDALAHDITTRGDQSGGFLAQSVGGGGGSGGVNISGAVTLAGTGGGAVSVGVGGAGGTGGIGRRVGATVIGDVATDGVKSDAVVAQSIGGGGGSGGFNISGTLAASGTGSGAVSVGVGGAGGTGGASGAVSLDVIGEIIAAGYDSDAIVAQSLGGGGGDGGFNVSGSIALAGKGAGAVSVGVGGSGGGGSQSDKVTLNAASGAAAGTSGNIFLAITTKDSSRGVVAQSIGGGGGNGAFNVSGGISAASNISGVVSVGVGGSGGGGGAAGKVDATITGGVATYGDESEAILLQSVGGGGGTGGFNVSGGLSGSSSSGVTMVGVGGAGGGGGGGAVAGGVTATIVSDVSTQGDKSGAIVVQSIGGGGGSGGFNISGGLSLGKGGSSGAVAVGVGGAGGLGGAAGVVEASVTGEVSTDGDDAIGLLIQSVGGGGGSGGMNISGAVALSSEGTLGVSVGLGGSGGGGGTAESVTLVRKGDTYTSGANSDGIVVQSIGGGGGVGGINVSGTISGSTGGSALGVAVGIGGKGGTGQKAGAVNATIEGSVVARGDVVTTAVYDEGGVQVGVKREGGASGVIVQSVGGGGGDGGINVSGDIAVSSSAGKSRQATFGIGGFGGGGGDAGDVTVSISNGLSADRAQMVAAGDGETAVLIQSVGGGGGSGGINIAGGLAMNGSATVGIGGFGADGGMGGVVLADVDADLYANGDRSRGLSVQSIGGGGGSGGINIAAGIKGASTTKEPALAFGLGGFGGAGNISNDVTVVQTGQVLVEGVEAIGVLVQSIAGGGGDGGLNVAAAASNGSTNDRGYSMAIGIGGLGGTGADAGDVKLTSNGEIVVNGQVGTNAQGQTILESVQYTGGATGVLVQSIGGGGGSGGINVTAVAAKAGSPLGAGVGGTGGAGGDGGLVTVVRGDALDPDVYAGTVWTFGDDSDGLVAQSIGGGGGNAGINATLVYAKSGAKEEDASVPSVAAVFAVGGNGGSAGIGDTVKVINNGDIRTDGADSDGLVAQSIGGGGGNANFNVGLGKVEKTTAVGLAIGGDPTSGGTGGKVDVRQNGVIVTKGEDSDAIVAQSIGGGGGNTAMNSVFALGASNKVTVGIGQEGGSGGAGGEVIVDVSGLLSTTGDSSNGVFAQSIGGGGGKSGTRSIGAQTRTGGDKEERTYNASLSVGLKGGSGATGGKVTVTSDAAIVTTGDESRGVFAQSIGGGGGAGGMVATNIDTTSAAKLLLGGDGGTGAKGGEVTVTQSGLIVTGGDRSDGIFAQSVGGGGGSGGAAIIKSKTKVAKEDEGAVSATLAIGVGGSGGDAAWGGVVTVANSGTIVTAGDYSNGVLAQSIGGGGGVGGAVVTSSSDAGSDKTAAAINVGGSGGTGALGGAVTVTNEGYIWTQGDYASGVSANSIGGGGGNAGVITNTLTVDTKENTTFRATLNVGGLGGDGGKGGDVLVINRPVSGVANSGRIVTEGVDSYGVFAQSIGGGGGNGTSIRSISTVKSGDGSTVAALNVGGAGGTGNIGGAVTVENHGLIDTSGDGAHGVLAQSIGGGGGNGGVVLAALVSMAQDTTKPLISVGGAGGDGGDGGTVRVENIGSIVTRGANANGILAQSIGGGGGNAGVALSLVGDRKSLLVTGALNLLMGAVGGGTGGQGGKVTVIQSGDITVLGEGSQAVVGQSINGGGGTLKLDMSSLRGKIGIPYLDKTGKVTTDPRLAARAGAQGVKDMNAAAVEIITTGAVGVAGDNGVGAFNQAIGGGGGVMRIDLGFAGDEAAAETDDAPMHVDVALGGQDGVGNAGGTLTSTLVGDVLTNGNNTPGVLDQSVGGGGGRAIIDLGTPGGASVGAVELALSGSSGVDEIGGAVNRTQTGSIATTGQMAAGAILQSLGGGGGLGSLDLTGQGAATTKPAISLGSVGGSGLDGGIVKAGFIGEVATYGDYASGLVAQSVGAGGGITTLSGVVSSTLALGGTGGAKGAGGDILLSHDGAVATTGKSAHGVFLQSIGGGGGAVFGASGASGVTLSKANTGDGGDISFTQSGGLLTKGEGANGVVAQTLGGGGGWVDGVFAGSAGGAGSGGAITLNLSDAILALGKDASAIFAQSLGDVGLGKDGAGDIRVVLDGAVRGGSETGVGLKIDGGAKNLVTTSGLISAISGKAIDATDGDETVRNSGVVIGDIDLGFGTNSFANNAGATFVAYHTIDLRDATGVHGLSDDEVMVSAQGVSTAAAGSAATFTNSGDFQMGLSASRVPIDLLKGEAFGNLDAASDPATNPLYGARVINTVALDGHFEQTATGHLAFDVAYGPYASDRVNVTGDATVAGTGDVVLTWLENSKPVTLFATGGKATDAGLKITDTLAMDYRIETTPTAVQLAFTSHFDQGFLNRNGQALGKHMNSAISLGDSSGIGRLMALIGNLQTGQEAAYATIFRNLSPEPYLAPLRSQLATSNSFSQKLFSCAQPTRSLDGKCSWASIETASTKGKADAEVFGTKSEGGRLSGGFEQPLAGDWSLAAGVGFERLDSVLVDGMRARSSGQGFTAGAGVKRRSDTGAEMAFSLSGGWQWMETARSVDVFTSGRGEAEPESGYVRADGRFAYVIENGRLFVRPAVNVWATGLHQQRFSETGVEGLGVNGVSHTQVLAGINPEVTLGFVFKETQKSQGAVSLTLGVVANSTDRLEMPFRLAGANPASDPAKIGTVMDKTAYRVGADVHLIGDDKVAVRFNYTGEFGDRTQSQSAGLNLRVRF
ncbi:autotransporter outer membrane beta-barrel domain-containing protein [Caulobacter hibisci]|uniref:Autotransporter outer membrane beta-barrel domain-containing protein n=1 Tax=Caulobacter hibisci TaxID=2035993 RepID=A0ABS0SW19_9CAUL|nr:autotransporter outer membrane beta-barrel domain-containing protein [Caulobacter hibisci]MBI1683798.1 autotransporter outer membrane beta-barrel domain-containing protein [Caulobacter hibisci]